MIEIPPRKSESELPLQQLPQQVIEEGHAADRERDQQRNLGGGCSGADTEAKREVGQDRGDGERCDDRGLAVPRPRRVLLGLVH